MYIREGIPDGALCIVLRYKLPSGRYTYNYTMVYHGIGIGMPSILECGTPT